MTQKRYDVVIIGGGPAGYAAALYCTRAGMSTLVLEKLSAGGQMATTNQVDNYPGFERGVDGFDLGEKMQHSAERFGAQTIFAEVTSVQLTGAIKTIQTDAGDFAARAVVLAMGASPRELGLPNERMLRSRGIAYCATCDGLMYRDKTVIVVGGGNSAAGDALFLSKICKKVYLVHRRDKLRATRTYLLPLQNTKNIEFIWNARVAEILADKKVTGAVLQDMKTDERRTVRCDGIFVAVGRLPNTALVRDQVTTDQQGYVVADESTRTNLPGVFAAGDLRTKALRQIVTAAADGATASKYIEEYLAETAQDGA